MKLPLPDELPLWYGIKPECNDDKKKDNVADKEEWTPPKTNQLKKDEVVNAWNGDIKQTENTLNNSSKINLDGLYAISPIQIGGGSFPEGLILPAQIRGTPCIPGSSLRGAFLNWINTKWNSFSPEEQQFWDGLLSKDGKSKGEKRTWLPRKIRFETTWIKTLKAYPLNSQQDWQVFGDTLQGYLKSGLPKPITKNSKIDSRKLAIQWQIQSVEEEYPWENPDNQDYSVTLSFKDKLSQKQPDWIRSQLEYMLLEQGIGRGTNTGFGRLSEYIPEGQWQIELEGMKPAIQSRNKQKRVEGEYRWSPQVLKACLRGYFTRLALNIMSVDNAKKLTNIIFGGFGSLAKLRLTSYLIEGQTKTENNLNSDFSNIPKDITDTVWYINVDCVDCSDELQLLIDKLLSLASRLGGLGAGWRRHHHPWVTRTKNGKKINLYRGSSFKVNSKSNKTSIEDLIQELHGIVTKLAEENNLEISPPKIPNIGSIVGIWRSNDPGKWRNVVHKTCKTNANNRPCWCGDNERPSSYAVKENRHDCLVTAFHSIEPRNSSKPKIEETLRKNEFTKIWACC